MIDDNQRAAHLFAMIPKSLDDLVRKNRHCFRLAISSDVMLSPLEGSFGKVWSIRDRVTNWRFVTLEHIDPRSSDNSLCATYLIGDFVGIRCESVTSMVKRIDLKRGLVETQNSIYEIDLGTRGKGEPPEVHLIMLAATFNSWGLGALFGTPEFFF